MRSTSFLFLVIVIVALAQFSSSQEPKPFTVQEKARILADHNYFRNQITIGNITGQPKPAKALPLLTWETELETLGKNWANTWKNENSFLVESPVCRGDAGANTIIIFPASNSLEATSHWFGENVYYNFETGICETGKICSHYSQIVNARTTKIGCGRSLRYSIPGYPPMAFVVCYYCFAPRVGLKPYIPI